MRRVLLSAILSCLLFQVGCSDPESATAPVSEDEAVEQPAEDTTEQASVDLPAATGPSEQDEALPVDPGEAYLYINAQKPGVQVMPSGLQFEILESGEGRSPGPESVVVTHYEGSLIDGTVFDSSRARNAPASFPVNRVIAGWTEALQMMNEGDRWRLVIPPALGYGERGAGGGRIPPNAVLVFDVQLLEVKEG